MSTSKFLSMAILSIVVLCACTPQTLPVDAIPGAAAVASETPTPAEPEPEPTATATEILTRTSKPTATATEEPTKIPESTATKEVKIIAGLPESLEETVIINEDELDEYLPKLLEKERELIKGVDLGFQRGHPDFGVGELTGGPGKDRIFSVWNGGYKEPLLINATSWTRVISREGVEMNMVGVVFKPDGITDSEEPLILHFIFPSQGMEGVLEVLGGSYLEYLDRYKQESIFEKFRTGELPFVTLRVVVEPEFESEWAKDPDWVPVRRMLVELEEELDFSHQLDEWSFYRGTVDFGRQLELRPIPAVSANWYD